ncbi:MAG TPA: ABC transporter permease [Acetobacteraceae bacterium]|jgi:putative spermidine/putrescine transport system permease protein|nr:ABC transporter permease [Acetobacteraceae bacterium]
MPGSAASATTAPGLPAAERAALRHSLRRAERRKRLGAFLLTLPLLAYLLLLFVIPLGGMVWLSLANPTLSVQMPRTVAALRHWQPRQANPGALPPEAAYAAVAADLRAAFHAHMFGRIAKRLNEEWPGAFGVISKTTFRTTRLPPQSSWKKVLEGIDPAWGELAFWRLLKRESAPVTADFYLAALDLQYGQNGNITRVPAYERIHLLLFLRTAWMSALITLLTLVLGYPLAYWISRMQERRANIVIIAVLLPFWTSLLVRIVAWIVLLQSHGVVNSVLIAAHLASANNPPKLIYNRLGTVIVMTQVLLPFTVLPLYSVMRGIPDSYVRAAVSLGAHPWRAFWKVFAPLSLPGVGAGVLLVFILALGYYITPELVGGQSGQFISNRIAFNVQESLNWGLAAALGTILTGVTLVLFVIYNRIIGIGRISLG